MAQWKVAQTRGLSQRLGGEVSAALVNANSGVVPAPLTPRRVGNGPGDE